MAPYDRALIPDSLRTTLGVPAQAEQLKKLEGMTAPNTNPDAGLGNRILSHDYPRRGRTAFRHAIESTHNR